MADSDSPAVSQHREGSPLRDAAPSLAWLLEMLANLNSMEPLDVILRPSGVRSRACQVHLPVGERSVLVQLLVLLRAMPGRVEPQANPVAVPADRQAGPQASEPAGETVDRHGRDSRGLTALQRAIIDHLETTPGNVPQSAKVIASRMGRANSGQFRLCLRDLVTRGFIEEVDGGGRFFAVEDFDGPDDDEMGGEELPDDGQADCGQDGMAGR